MQTVLASHILADYILIKGMKISSTYLNKQNCSRKFDMELVRMSCKPCLVLMYP